MSPVAVEPKPVLIVLLSDRDLSIQEKVSRTLDLASELPELRSIAETLAADAE